MKFICRRTSDYPEREQPCDEATQEDFILIRGYGYKTDTFTKWVVNLETLEDLRDFVKKYDKVIIGEEYFVKPEAPNDRFNFLEIYDDYRE